MAKYLATEALSNKGRATIILLWVLMTWFSILGVKNITSDFSLELFLIAG